MYWQVLKLEVCSTDQTGYIWKSNKMEGQHWLGCFPPLHSGSQMRGCKSNSGIAVNDRGSDPPCTDYSYVQSGKLAIPPWKRGECRANGGLSPHPQILRTKQAWWELRDMKYMPQLGPATSNQHTTTRMRSFAPKNPHGAYLLGESLTG